MILAFLFLSVMQIWGFVGPKQFFFQKFYKRSNLIISFISFSDYSTIHLKYHIYDSHSHSMNFMILFVCFVVFTVLGQF